MIDKKPISFAIVGLGHIGRRHQAIIQGHPGCELLAACDIDPEIVERAASESSFPVYPSMEEMLHHHPEVEALSICTPNGLHASQAILALQAGHHVVLEKPMGLTRSSCEEVLHHSLRHNRKVFCVMQNRYSPPSAWLKSVIEENVLGEIYVAQINCYWNRDERYYQAKSWKGSLEMDGGPLFTQFSHFVDTLYWLLGDITDIRARFRNFRHTHNTEFEDSGTVDFRLVKGGMGVINYSTANWDQNFESSITLIGEKGTIKVGGQYMERIEYCHVQDYEAPTLPPANPPNDYGHYKGSAANHHFVFENVVNTLRGDSVITTNALEGLKVVDIIERIYALRDLSAL
jgi:UDP-N-acetyl-2-amino-2-deoxyglucuronate dehydrogenase